MKKIVLENNNFLRKHVKKIEIDNDDINFINGLAVVNATVYTFQLLQDASGSYTPKTTIYNCIGVINEEYKEAFPVNSNTDASKYLSFLEQNKSIIRIGANDFIIKTREVEQGKVYYPFTHVRLINQMPQVVFEKSRDFCLTSVSNIAIFHNCFYFITARKFFGLKFKSIKEDSNHPGEFIIVDEITIPALSEQDGPIIDTLACRIDVRLQVKSDIYSMLENAIVCFRSMDYMKVHNERIEQLQEKRAEFLNHISSLEEVYKQIL